MDDKGEGSADNSREHTPGKRDNARAGVVVPWNSQGVMA